MLAQIFIHKSYQPQIQLHNYLLDFFICKVGTVALKAYVGKAKNR